MRGGVERFYLSNLLIYRSYGLLGNFTGHTMGPMGLESWFEDLREGLMMHEGGKIGTAIEKKRNPNYPKEKKQLPPHTIPNSTINSKP